MVERAYGLAALAGEIRDRAAPAATRLVAVDGCGGAGKSTLARARALAAACGGVPIVRVDDFLSWHGLHRWWPRFEHEALRPVLAGAGARYRVRDWARDPLGENLDEMVEIPPADLVIVEGISCSRRAIAPELTMALWVHAPRSERLRRGVARDGEHRRALWVAWQRDEDEFFAADGAPDRGPAHRPRRPVAADRAARDSRRAGHRSGPLGEYAVGRVELPERDHPEVDAARIRAPAFGNLVHAQNLATGGAWPALAARALEVTGAQ